MTDKTSLLQLITDIDGLSIFSSLKKHPLLQTFRNVLTLSYEQMDLNTEYILHLNNAWSSFITAFILDTNGKSFFQKIRNLTIKDDNAFTRAAEQNLLSEIDSTLRVFAETDLLRLGNIASANIREIGFAIVESMKNMHLLSLASSIEKEYSEFRLIKENDSSIFSSNLDWGNSIEQFADYIHETGCGEFGQHKTFCWNSLKKSFVPVANQDKKGLKDLHGYEDQRNIIISNTLRFLDGKSANNLLLYGDRGTGKSATVKAVCNEYANRRLRLLELKKKDLFDLPEIMEQLSSRALRFVLFVDDLSFEETDGSFSALKAFLEGGVEGKPNNLTVYATSNRRHLVKEKLEDRPGSSAAASGDIRAFDTMQEQFSLADRFGVTVIFTSPNQDDYLGIAEFLAEQKNLLDSSSKNDDARKVFRDNALRWERWFNGRSPRTAVQFVNWLEGGATFPWE